MVTPLEKFRAQYPEGGLTADLVSLHDGQYIVRAVIAYKGGVLATGLAAHTDVTIAEDQARERAIAALIIHPTTSPQASAPPIENAPINERSHPSENVQLTDLSSDHLSEPAEEDLGPPIDIINDDPTHHPLIDEGPIESSPPAAKPSVATLALENYTHSPHPVDLSDVMAQTSVELTRLGWTSEQGREYLERTYGRRSRHQLTDEELMSFLLHLEDQ